MLRRRGLAVITKLPHCRRWRGGAKKQSSRQRDDCLLCLSKSVIHIGFEPMTSSLSRKRSKPTELMNRTFVVGPMGAVSVIRLGLKPRTRSLEGCCSIQLSYRTGKKPRQLLSFVPGPGLEPGWVSPTVFETVASAYSAIRAYCRSFCVAKVRVFFVLTKFLIAQLNDLVYLVAQKGLKWAIIWPICP